jgi:putative transcriptional regulator
MLNENLKMLRKEKGFSQEELASKVHVVRQTVSKWEKGLSVPDAEMLVQIADVFEVPVSRLLGATLPAAEDDAPDQRNEIAEQLMKINEQLVIKNNRTRKIIKWLIIIFVVIPAALILLSVLLVFLFRTNVSSSGSPEIETGYIDMLL